MGCIGAGCLQGPRGGPTAQTDCRMSPSVSLYGGGVYGVYWGGVFTGLSGPQPRLTVGCRRLSPCMGAGCMGYIGAGCLRGSQAHSPD